MPSRFALKVGANSFFALVATVALVSLFAENTRDNFLNEVRDDWVTHDMESLNEEAELALAQQELDQNPDILTRTLGSSPWDQLRPGDRGYHLKRKLIVRLCITLQEREDYERLARWAETWLAMNDRDLDARAFWFEGIRHISGREIEGLEGLIANYHDFPENHYLRSFLATAYLDRGDPGTAIRVLGETGRSMASQVLSNWQIFWTTSDSDFFSESRSTRIALSRGNGSETTLQFELPADTTAIRIDLPPKSHLRVYSLQISIGEVRREITVEEVSLSQIRRERETLIADGGEDPYFVLPVERIGGTNQDVRIAVTLQLQVNVVVLGHDLNLTELFEET